MINQSAVIRTRVTEPRRLLLLGVGYIGFATGFAGMFLPILPTTVFWIIAACCFARSSPVMYARIVSWPGVGLVIKDFLERGIIHRRSKMIALAGMAVAGALVLFTGIGVGLMVLAFVGIVAAATYVATRPSH